jgi:anthranilate phosphoribosyltransferase
VKSVQAIRSELGVPTIFNWLGPLVNPAAAGHQLLGVGRPELRTTMAQVLARLGTLRSAVVWGQDGLDEVTIDGPTDVSLVTPDGIQEFTWAPEDFGLCRWSRVGLTVASPQESAELIRSVLAGQRGAARDLVVINAAAALWTAGEQDSLRVCRQRAESAIDRGAAANLLTQLGELSRRADS